MATLGQAGASLTIAKPPATKPLISPQQLLQIEPKIGNERANELAPILSDVCLKYGITTRLRLAAFLATVVEETGAFTRFEENLNYTTAARIKAVWPSRFPTLASAQPYVRNPIKLASKVYANRLGNGSEASEDGYRYRGVGAIQITGKDMHLAYQKYAGVSEEKMRSDNYCLIDSAGWYFVIYNKAVIPLADKGQFAKLTVSVNGAMTNYIIRQKYYDRAMKVFA